MSSQEQVLVCHFFSSHALICLSAISLTCSTLIERISAQLGTLCKKFAVMYYVHIILSDNSHHFFTQATSRDSRKRSAHRFATTPWVGIHADLLNELLLISSCTSPYIETVLGMRSVCLPLTNTASTGRRNSAGFCKWNRAGGKWQVPVAK